MDATRTRVAGGDSAERSWEIVFCEPNARLTPHVQVYEGYWERTSGATLRKHFPGGGMPMIILFEDGFRTTANPDMPLESRNAFVAGMHDTYALTDSGASTSGVQINLSPLAAYRMFGLPMHELSGHALELDDVLGDDARVLAERVRDAPDWRARFGILDDFFEERLATGPAPSEAVGWAWGQLTRYDGQVEIRGLADEIGWSGKRLIAEFRQHVGLAPKTAARVLRFQKAVRLFEADPSRRWSDVALRSGYYDQAHFIRDFRQFAGATPSEYVQQRLPEGGGVRGS